MDTPTVPFLGIFIGHLLGWTLLMYLPNFTSVALPVPEIIGGTLKNWGVPGYAHGPFSRKILMGFAPMDPVNVSAEFYVRGFTRS